MGYYIQTIVGNQHGYKFGETGEIRTHGELSLSD